MANRLYESVDHAKAYSLHRPPPPSEMIDITIGYLREELAPPHGHAVDVGCGTGQSTIAIAPFFESVIGCDISKAQIQEAKLRRKLPNITYKVAAAESLPVPDHSVHLLIAGTSLHWFNKDAFFKEAKRVLAPGGVLAAYASLIIYPLGGDKEKDCLLRQATDKFMFEDIKAYRSPRVQLIVEQYGNIHFPFDDVLRINSIGQTYVSSAAHMTGYIRSASTFQKFREARPEEADRLLLDYNKRLLEILGIQSATDVTPVTYRQDYFLILCRKSNKKITGTADLQTLA